MTSGEVIDADNSSVIELFRVHQKSVDTGRQASSTGSIRRPTRIASAVKLSVLYVATRDKTKRKRRRKKTKKKKKTKEKKK